MPYTIAERDGKFCVVKKTTGKQVACHATREGASKQIAAIMANETTKRFSTLCKVDSLNSELGLVFGWAIISKEDGVEYYDTQGDYIPDETILKRTMDFMLAKRVSGEMHEFIDGEVIFAFPLTEEIAKAMGVVSRKYGLMYGYKPSPEVFAKFKSGEYTGFSIGGERLDEQVVEA